MYTVSPLEELVELAEVELAVAVVLVLFDVGSSAPHGWSCRHADAQVLSLPQAVTHWLPHSVHTK